MRDTKKKTIEQLALLSGDAAETLDLPVANREAPLARMPDGSRRSRQPGAVDMCELRVDGMDCASCAASIEAALRRVEGVQAVDVDVVGGTVRIGHTRHHRARSDFAGAIRRVGFAVRDDAPEASTSTKSFWPRRGRLVMAVSSGVALLLAFAASYLGIAGPATTALLALATFAGGWYVVPRGLRSARNRALDMNFLMTIAAVGAWLIGDRAEAAATMFLFAVAELLESYSMDRARKSIQSLVELAPAEAVVRRNGGEVRVPIADVRPGEIVVVRPGDKLPVDGVVVDGRSSVNQAPITGESMPVDKEHGAEVFAGTLNGNGRLDIRSTRPATDTTLAGILHAVEEAQATRAPTQRWVDRFAQVYTPAVVGVALLLAIIPPLIGMGGWNVWIYRALATLVVACPCALVISTPVTIVSGLTGGARAGILIKGGVHLENLAHVTTVAIDKTGTLTEGKPVVTDVVPLGGASRTDLLNRALLVEQYSEHPIAQTIVSYARELGAVAAVSCDFETLVGRGARATTSIGERKIETLVGSRRLADDLKADSIEIREAVDRLVSEGKTAVVVLERQILGDGKQSSIRPLGVIAIADRERPHAAEAMQALRELHVRRLVMLTGDNRETASAIGAAVGIREVHAELLPEDKAAAVRALEVAGERVAFLGDGVNDAPALASATVGIAMGVAGSGVAIETADVALMGNDLRLMARAIGLARHTLYIVKQNVAFAVAVKAIFLVLAVAGWATLWMAIAADMGSSLLVVANGLRARHLRP